jgi:rhomboid protease GluP
MALLTTYFIIGWQVGPVFRLSGDDLGFNFTPTVALVANIGMYVLNSVLGGAFVETSEWVLVTFGQTNFLVAQGWYWQLFSAIFVHVNLAHLAGNMLFLLIFGFRAEKLFTTNIYFFIYFASGLLGNLLSLLMPPLTVSAGASGAIFGLFGASVVYVGKTFGRSVTSALIYAFFLLLITAGTGVNFFAHFGGLATGLLIGYAIAKSRSPVFTFSLDM